ncbi:MAG: hypothetical protein ABIL58_18730 [Pseudomonadota bacterium]
MKKVWITSLVRDEAQVATLLGLARKYGLDANGHFWVDDLEHMAWQAALENLAGGADLWVIAGAATDIAPASVRYGLSLLALSVQAARGNGFPILWAVPSGDMDPANLPTPLRGAAVMAVTNASLGAKIVARANTPVPKVATDYRLSVHANAGFGVWLEVGPGKGATWSGALLGVSGGGIDAHGVGPAGKLPSRAVLEYPMKGLQIELGEKKYTAWAVQNQLEEGASYYVRITETPASLLFGPYSQEDAAEVHVIDL